MQDTCEQYFQQMITVHKRTMHKEVFSLGVNELLISPQVYCTGVPQNSNSKCNSRLHSWLKNNYKIRQWIREQKTPKHFNRHFKAAHANHKTNNTNSGNGKASAVG